MYYLVITQLGKKLSRAQVPKNNQSLPYPGHSYKCYRGVFDVFRFVQRDGRSKREIIARLQKKGRSSQYFYNCPEPKSELREFAIWDRDGFQMPCWADFRLLEGHLNTVFGYLGCVVRAQDVCLLWKVGARYSFNGKSSRSIKFYYSFVFVRPDGSIRPATPSHITADEMARIKSIVPALLRRINVANVRYPHTVCPGVCVANVVPDADVPVAIVPAQRVDPELEAAVAVAARENTVGVQQLLNDFDTIDFSGEHADDDTSGDPEATDHDYNGDGIVLECPDEYNCCGRAESEWDDPYRSSYIPSPNSSSAGSSPSAEEPVPESNESEFERLFAEEAAYSKTAS